jgi:outer membrane protein OmpA-like peptidoglycan-associated protein
VVGGLAGVALDSKKGRGALLDAAAGAALGGGIGYLLDRQKAELEQALEPERKAQAATVEKTDADLLKVTISDEVAFDHESTAIRPSFLPTLEKVADVPARHDNARLLVIGHTDSTGPESYNQELSRARAQAVRDALVTYGVDAGRIRAEGRGESEPRADNGSEAGRAANRRVEILITPIT